MSLSGDPVFEAMRDLSIEGASMFLSRRIHELAERGNGSASSVGLDREHQAVSTRILFCVV